MESWIRRIFLKLVCAAMLLVGTQLGYANEDEELEVQESSPLIEPFILRLDLDEAEIDTENFEIGVFFGQISIEDFGTNDVYAATAAFHVTEDFFLEGVYGDSDMQRPLEEDFVGGITLPGELDYNHYNLSLGWNIFPGEVFIWKDWAFNSQIYVIGGVGVTEYFSEKDTTFNVGVGYRMILWDWLALRLDFRDHVFKRDRLEQLGEQQEKTVQNLELRFGASVFF